MSRWGSLLTLLIVAGGSACASPTEGETHTFFQNDEDLSIGRIEVPFPPLNRPAQAGAPAYVGVTALEVVRFSRPETWHVRRASTLKDHRYVEYASPNEYLFAIYERPDSAGASWSDVLIQYEADAKTHGVEFVGRDIPTAGEDTQGREYVLKRKIKGQREPWESTSREFVFRGKHYFALVELVHQGQSDASIEREVLRAIQTLSVL
jgi:hypothetical protein